MYSFGVNADKQDPEGTLNFSKLDMVTLSYTNKAATAADISQVFDLSTTLENGITKFKNITIFSKNFNVLRIVEGMGGVLFAN
ncbi:major capsid protein VP54 [Paramecium bursaria Chlorella virus MA1E]|nr:major capsid protein VP54 [Paramecium bursaria Chlorella virus MA1E]